MNVRARPPVKWLGGKTSLLPEILPRLPQKINTYYEPFLGGGAVFFALAAEGRFKHAMLGDSNEELILACSALSGNPDKVIAALRKHVYEEEHYYAVRALDPKKLAPHARAARFIYLNKTGFNGLYRVNKKGQFNVPFGRYVNPMICDEENLRAVSNVLARVDRIALLDFESLVAGARRGDAVYCDPPYVPVSDTANFTAYTAGGFGSEEQTRLRDVATRLADRGVHVLLSNSDTPFVRKLYKGWKMEKVRVKRAINSKGDKRGDVGELLISEK